MKVPTALRSLGLGFFLFVLGSGILAIVLHAHGKSLLKAVKTADRSDSRMASVNVEVLDGWRFTTGRTGGTVIAGTVVNHASKKLNRVQVTFNIYDKSGAYIGIASATGRGLEPNASWRFETDAAPRGVVTAKLAGTAGF
jgi:hypothetical protein